MRGFIGSVACCGVIAAGALYFGYTAMAKEQDNMHKQISDYCRVYGAECDRRLR